MNEINAGFFDIHSPVSKGGSYEMTKWPLDRIYRPFRFRADKHLGCVS